MVHSVAATPAARKAMVREQQRETYGMPLRHLVHGLAEDYGVNQARLARVIGISQAMLSQLISAQRIKIGDPVANTRLMILAERRAHARRLEDPTEIDEMLASVARVRRPWPRHRDTQDVTGSTTELLRGAATPQELAAAAIRLQGDFPAIAHVLRQVAAAELG